jgi:hypothetical protein
MSGVKLGAISTEEQFHLRSANTLWHVVTVCAAAFAMCGMACVDIRQSFAWRLASPNCTRALRHIAEAAPVAFHLKFAFLRALK